MKIYYTILIALLLMACGGSKSIYHDKNITEKKLEKLIREYSANSNDTSTADQLKFAYNYLHQQLLSEVSKFQYAVTLEGKENLLNSYTKLQSFYHRIKGYRQAADLLKPGSVGTEMEKTTLELVSRHYDNATQWIAENNWRSARSAYTSLGKVQQWMPDYKNTKQLLKEAKNLGTINAVLLPLSAEGMYYSQQNNNNGVGTNAGSTPLFSEQLIRDLANNYNSWYQVYNIFEAKRQNIRPNWTITPVWTQLRLDDKRSRQYQRTVEKQTEIGKDTTGKPIYKLLTATLTINETTYNGTGILELRITDEDNHENIRPRTFSEEYNFKASTATYKGDAGALSNADWELINAPRYDNNRNQQLMEQKILEKMYPNVLHWLRGQLNQ